MAGSRGRPTLSAVEVAEFRAKIGAVALEIYLREGLGAVSLRRLSRDADCSTATLYAHFAGKQDILRYLWGHVLDDATGRIETGIADLPAGERVRAASVLFVRYWQDNPDRFRLVFMAEGVSRDDVAGFLETSRARGYFDLFRRLIGEDGAVHADGAGARADTLIAGLIGVSLSLVTIADYPWPDPGEMVDLLLAGVMR